MKKWLAFGIGIFIIKLVAAQSISENTFMKISSYIVPELANAGNVSVVKQIGDDNTTIIQQHLSEMTNQILTVQFGTDNSVNIKQTGSSHETRLFQTGNNNETILNVDGASTYSNIKQFGNENIIYSSLSNLGKQVHSVMLDQAGNSNKIELEVEGNSFSQETNYSISVSQRGNELGFKGSYESSSLPVEITQKSGKDGGGMSVIVTSSSFYFPMK